MEYIIEIGDSEQQAIIRSELLLVTEALESVESEEVMVGLRRIIIPQDFDAKVNELQNSSDYVSTRGVGEVPITAQAKTIFGDDGASIVLSRWLYTDTYDTAIRRFILLHELCHVINRYYFPSLPIKPSGNLNYLGSLYTMYDEYKADRIAYLIMDAFEDLFQSEAERWRHYREGEVTGFKSLLMDLSYYLHIKSEIAQFRQHADIGQFLRRIKVSWDNVCLATVHLFALIHHKPNYLNQEELFSSRFVNESTIALMEFFKEKYEARNTDLDEGLPLVTEYFKLFGFRFEDHSEGTYCHVLDI